MGSEPHPTGAFNKMRKLKGRLHALKGYDARLMSSADSKAFIDPERKPSRSRVTNLNPSLLKMPVKTAAISGVMARDSSSLAISRRAISP